MHFSIPETESRSGDSGGPAYVAYNIHVNGVLHCRVRYSQLLGLRATGVYPGGALVAVTPAGGA